MTRETVNYASLDDVKNAKKRSSIRHQNGQESKNTSKNEDGSYTVVWILPDDPIHSNNVVPVEEITMTERKFIEMLAEQHNVKIQFSFRDTVRSLLGL